MNKCQCCEVLFEPILRHPNQKYCSKKCLEKIRGKIDYQKYKLHERKRSLEYYYKHRNRYLLKNRKYPPQAPRKCKICGKMIFPSKHSPLTTMCSEKCRWEKFKKKNADWLERCRIAARKWRLKPEGKIYERYASKKEDKRKRNWIKKTNVLLSFSDWKEVMSLGYCVYCGSTKQLSHDHIIPLVKKGLDYKHNCVCCCRKCNCELKRESNVFDFCLKNNFEVPKIVYEKLGAYKNFLTEERPDLLQLVFS